MNEQISLSKLTASKDNVRKTYSEEGIKEMKASILAHGLMQNLVVKKAGDKYEVVSGNRRFVALQQLEKEGKLGKNNLINCRVMIPGESSEELSLVENVVREEMHPADEFEAYSELMKDKAMTTEKIALRFGKTKKYVEQRLLLARVAPELMKAFRSDKIDIECLMAFTICDDHKRQVSVYKSLSSWDKNARSIRQKLGEKMAKATSKIAIFVGEAAYTKAGGTIKGDLFSEEKYFENTQLLDKLANAKVKAEVDKLAAEGWGFVEVGQDWGYEFRSKFDEIKKPAKKSDLANCGIYMHVDSDGKLQKVMLKKRAGKAGEKAAAAAKKKKDTGGLSQSLRDDLADYRMEIAQMAISNDPKLAFDLMAYHLATALDAGRYAYGGYSSMSFSQEKPRATVSAAKTRVSKLMKDHGESLDMSWRKHKTEQERFDAFIALSYDKKLAIVAHAFALSIKPHFTGKIDKNLVDLAFNRIDCVPSMFWRPTKENYLSRITTEQLNAIGKELFEKDWKAQNGKAGLVKTLHDVFADPKKAAGGVAERQKRIEAWLPAGFAFTLPESDLKKKAA